MTRLGCWICMRCLTLRPCSRFWASGTGIARSPMSVACSFCQVMPDFDRNLQAARVPTAMALTFLLAATPALAAPARPAPALAPPSGTIVHVSTERQLRTAVSAMSSNRTIVLAPGTYTLTDALYLNGTFTNVGIRGATNNSDDVVLVGAGMKNAAVPYGIWVGGNVQGVTIANLTIRDVYDHPIIFNAGTQSPLVHNVHLINAGEQFIKSNPDGAGGGVNNGIVEYSVIEYVTTSPTDYTNGVDVHTGVNWVVRNNLFKSIRAPQGMLAGPAILMWNASSGSVAEGNTFINCQREIAFGLVERRFNDHTGGIIRNNFIYRDSTVGGTGWGDTAIGVGDSPGTQVLHNTILLSGTYSTPIEYRFAGSTGVVISRNLLDGSILARDGATASVSGNVTAAAADMFVNPGIGDLHLKASASTAPGHVTRLGNCLRDWDGDRRGASTDVGGDEYGSGATPGRTIQNVWSAPDLQVAARSD